jgi:TetR/AcrR family transcriptional repressor of nem operon
MTKVSNREKILTEGLRIVHERGFANASVRDIVQAAGVPQGSFTNHFPSKEAFGLEIIERYFEGSCNTIAQTLRNDERAPLERFGAYIDTQIANLGRTQMKNGCLYGNFTAEIGDTSEPMRARVAAIFGETRSALAYCLRAAVVAGEITKVIDPDDIAAFVMSSLQGAILLSKAYRSVEPVERCKRILFAMILH